MVKVTITIDLETEDIREVYKELGPLMDRLDGYKVGNVQVGETKIHHSNADAADISAAIRQGIGWWNARKPAR